MVGVVDVVGLAPDGTRITGGTTMTALHRFLLVAALAAQTATGICGRAAAIGDVNDFDPYAEVLTVRDRTA